MIDQFSTTSEVSPAQIALRFISSTKQHVFLTGNAGTGKTTFLQDIVKRTYKRTAVVAPTGIAALNAGGSTIHSLFQLPPATFLPIKHLPSLGPGNSMIYDQSHLLKEFKMYNTKRKLLRELELLIIDEVSMLRADLLDAIDLVLRTVRKSPQSFGGVQVLFIGDLMQLPPVVRDDMRDLLAVHYKSPFFFDAKVLERDPPVYVELDKIFRQKDQRFIDLLNHLRNNRLSADDEQLLNQYFRPGYRPGLNDGVITLTTHNYKADNLNKSALAQLPGESFRYKAEVEGDFPGYMYPTEEYLELKLNAQVMFMKNDTSGNGRYFNGKIGRIVHLDHELIEVLCPDDDRSIKITRYEWENIKFSLNESSREIQQKVVGTFRHFPIKLAWAITIHKSQGLTFDRAIVDPKDAFASGQIYVALSRLRSLNGLVLSSPINRESLFAELRVVEYADTKPGIPDLVELANTRQLSFIQHELEQGLNVLSLLNQARSECRFRQEDKLYADPLLPFFNQLNERLEGIQKQCLEFQNASLKLLKTLKPGKNEEDISPFRSQLDTMNQSLEELCNGVHKTQDKFRHQFESEGDAEQLAQLEHDLREKQERIMRCGLLLFKSLKGEILEKSMLNSRKQESLTQKQGPTEKPTVSKAEYYKNKYSKSSKSSVPKKKKGFSEELSLALFKEGREVSEIARQRELSEGTIYGHLRKWVEKGVINLDRLVAEPKRQKIEQVLQQKEQLTLSEAKSQLGGDISYDDIRLVMAQRTSNSKS